MFGLLRLAFGAAAKGATTRGATAVASRGVTSSLFGAAARHPILATGAAAIADQKLNGGRGTSAAFNAARNAVLPKLANMNGGDYLKYGAFGIAAASLLTGNTTGAVGFATAGIFMKQALEFMDPLLNKYVGIDIPDNWYKDAPAASPAAPAPAMG